MTKEEILTTTVIEVLKATPYKPFLCLQLSALFYATLKDRHQIHSKIVTGDLLYKGQYIFKQDFSISDAKDGVFNTWSGHAWVEIDDLICDLSFFRTLYSESFTKPCKTELINYFGEGRGCFIDTKEKLLSVHLKYNAIDSLNDEMATGIIAGFEPLLKTVE